MVDDEVEVVYTKFDGSLGWHATLTHLGQDEHGVWLRARPGPTWQRGADPPVDFPGHVLLIPGTERKDGIGRTGTVGWTAKFNANPAVNLLYADITTTPVWQGRHRVTMIDLDLDLARLRATEQVVLLDEDEFLSRQTEYGYPAELIAAATASARRLHVAISDETEPFGSHYRRWLAQVEQCWP